MTCDLSFAIITRKHLTSLNVLFSFVPIFFFCIEHYTWSIYFLLFRIMLPVLILFVVFIFMGFMRYMYVCVAWWPRSPRECIGFPGTGVIASCELSYGFWQLNLDFELGSPERTVSTLNH